MNTSINSDVSGNEEVIAETSEDSNINQNETLEEEEATEEETVAEVQIDYTSHFQMIEGLLFINVTILLAVGCIIAWVGARYE